MIQEKGRRAKTLRKVHGLIFLAMEFAARAGYRPDNQCRGMRLPVGEKVGDDAQFLTLSEFALLLNKTPTQYRLFVQFLVLTGTRYGEATAVAIDDLDLAATPATVRINKAWRRDGNNTYYVGTTKTRRETDHLPAAGHDGGPHPAHGWAAGE
ncbi:MAG: hypothetical protein WBX27_15730 [Specibacter sp.]